MTTIETDRRARIRLEDIRITFPLSDETELLVVDGISFSVGVGEFVAVVGPSGCGKSTILRAISGLIAPSAGKVFIDGAEAVGTPEHIGFMFQKDALLPWRTVSENIGVGLELGGVPPGAREDRIRELVALLQLEGFETTYPKNLSGGMRQRVSLGRLLAYQPNLMLMDEPFGALDYQTKIKMGRELLRIWEVEKRSIIFVTHDVEEAIRLADRVIVFGPRPAKIAAEYEVDLPRPRDLSALRSDPRFTQLTEAIWSDLALTS